MRILPEVDGVFCWLYTYTQGSRQRRSSSDVIAALEEQVISEMMVANQTKKILLISWHIRYNIAHHKFSWVNGKELSSLCQQAIPCL